MNNKQENIEKQATERTGAVRIFESLSSVDGELLERCDKMSKVVPFWRYHKMLAACACFIVLGVVTWTGSMLLSTNKASESASDTAAAVTENQMVAEDAADGVTSGTETDSVAAEVLEEENGMKAASTEQESSKTEAVGMSEDVGTPIEEVKEYLSLEELRAIEGVGQYIPTIIPDGYVFENGYRIDEEMSQGISMRFAKGMDDIRIVVERYEADTETEKRIVDISKPETYDVNLYEIPYCNSLPEEYREIFDNPIFMECDMSLAIVEARMKSVTDQGDTDTPRGNFAVLYDSGVLVRISGECDVESIWEMFESIGR